jgi:hypothetical protein
LDPTEGPPGTEVRVQGSGWIPGYEGDPVELYFTVNPEDSSWYLLSETTVGTDGTFTATVAIPADAAIEEYYVLAIIPEVRTATAFFQVTESTKQPSCPEPTVTLSASSVSTGDTVTLQGAGWLPGGTVTSTATGPIKFTLNPLTVPDSGEWEWSFTIVPEFAGGDYELVFSENHEGCELLVQEVFTIEAPESDTEPPTVSWVKPVGNREYYPTANSAVELEVSATDNAGIRSVLFERWDAVNLQVIELSTDSSPPYQAKIGVNTLNIGWNQINAIVEDTAGNHAGEPE